MSFSEFFGHEFCWFGVSGFVWVSIFRNLVLPEVIPQHFAFMVLFQPPDANHGLLGLVGTGPRICPLPALRPLMLPSGVLLVYIPALKAACSFSPFYSLFLSLIPFLIFIAVTF